MKKIIIFLLFSLFFLPQFSYAGEVIFDFDPSLQQPQKITFEQRVENLIEISKYFDEKYPSDKIDEDMSDDVSQFFPELTLKENKKR